MTHLLLIRHGDTDAVGHYMAGVAPGVHLNDRGRAQVVQLVTALHDVRLDAVVSSPLERTRETAEPIATDHGLPVDVEPLIIEYNVGAWTGATFESLAGDPVWSRFNSVRSLTRPERGELMIDVQQRAVTAVNDISRRYRSGTVAIVSHGDVIRSLLLYVLGMPIDFYYRIEVQPARISVVALTDAAPRVLLMNADSTSGVL